MCMVMWLCMCECGDMDMVVDVGVDVVAGDDVDVYGDVGVV